MVSKDISLEYAENYALHMVKICKNNFSQRLITYYLYLNVDRTQLIKVNLTTE